MAKGSIEKRGDNTWRLTHEFGVDALGERNRERRTITIEDPTILRAPKRLREYLEHELAKFKIDLESGALVKPEKTSFTELANIWREEHAKSAYSPRAYENYTDRLDSHVKPYFERMFVDEIKPLHVLRFKNYLDTPDARKDGKSIPLSRSTQLFIYKVFTAIMSFALKELQLITENPVTSVAAPKVVHKKKKKQESVYGEEEAINVIIAILRLPDVWMIYFLGAMMGGFRRGELLALEWTNVDYSNDRIYIGQSISWTKKGEAALKGTKEDNEEWVYMPKWYMKMLKSFQVSMNEERLGMEEDDWLGGDKLYVFQNGYGKPYYHDTPTATWRKFLVKNKLRHIRLHDLRHTAAALLIEDGVSLKLIQERLRHISADSTEIYAHVTSKASRGVADRLEKFDPSQLKELGTDWGRDSSEPIDLDRVRYLKRKSGT